MVLVAFVGAVIGWIVLFSFIGPVLGAIAIPVGIIVIASGGGLWVVGVWSVCSTGLVALLRYKLGVREYLESMNNLRYSVGGEGYSLDLETFIWAFLLPGRVVLKVLWLERSPNARYIKTVPLTLGDCNRYHE